MENDCIFPKKERESDRIISLTDNFPKIVCKTKINTQKVIQPHGA